MSDSACNSSDTDRNESLGQSGAATVGPGKEEASEFWSQSEDTEARTEDESQSFSEERFLSEIDAVVSSNEEMGQDGTRRKENQNGASSSVEESEIQDLRYNHNDGTIETPNKDDFLQSSNSLVTSLTSEAASDGINQWVNSMCLDDLTQGNCTGESNQNSYPKKEKKESLRQIVGTESCLADFLTYSLEGKMKQRNSKGRGNHSKIEATKENPPSINLSKEDDIKWIGRMSHASDESRCEPKDASQMPNTEEDEIQGIDSNEAKQKLSSDSLVSSSFDHALGDSRTFRKMNRCGEHVSFNESAEESSSGDNNHEACSPFDSSTERAFLEDLISTSEDSTVQNFSESNDHKACDLLRSNDEEVFLENLISTGELESEETSDCSDQNLNRVHSSSNDEQSEVKLVNQTLHDGNETEDEECQDLYENEELIQKYFSKNSFQYIQEESIVDVSVNSSISYRELIKLGRGNFETRTNDWGNKTNDETEPPSLNCRCENGSNTIFENDSYDDRLRPKSQNRNAWESEICEPSKNSVEMRIQEHNENSRFEDEKGSPKRSSTSGVEIALHMGVNVKNVCHQGKDYVSANDDNNSEQVSGCQGYTSPGGESEIFSDGYAEWVKKVGYASSPRKKLNNRVDGGDSTQKRKFCEGLYVADKRRRSEMIGEQKLNSSSDSHLNQSNVIGGSHLRDRDSIMDHQSQSGIKNDTAKLSEIAIEDNSRISSKEESRVESTVWGSNEETFAGEKSCSTNYSLSGEEDVKKLRSWMVRSRLPHNHGDELMKILREKRMPNLPASTKTFLKKKSEFRAEEMDACDGSTGEFIYIGLEKKLQSTIQPKLHPDNVAELAFGVDGFNPFKSSKRTVWPILCKVFKKNYKYKIFTVAVYAGKSKPKCANEFLRKFVEELNHLLKNGIKINGVLFRIKIKFFICDTPARAFLKLWIGHASLVGCERCVVVGKKVNGVTVFLDIDALKRTNISFRTFAQPECHNGVSILILLDELDPINHFILDPMHSVYLGPAKRVLDYLLGEPKKKKSRKDVKLTSALKLELKRRTEMIQGDIPDEFPRKMRPTDEYNAYKAVEWKFFVHYAAPIVLKRILNGDLYKHVLNLIIGCRLLSVEEVQPHIAKARELFLEFVQEAPRLYGPEFVSLLVHCLIHLCDDVERYGLNLNDLSAFEFESYLGFISRLLRSPEHLVVQYCNRMEEAELYLAENDETDSKTLAILSETKAGKVHKIKYNKMILSDSHPNSTVLLQDKVVAEIQRFEYAGNDLFAVVKKFKKKFFLDSSKWDPEIINIWEISHLSSEESKVQLDDIVKKFVRFHMNFSKDEDKKIFVIPLLH